MVKVSRRGFFGRMMGKKTFREACFAIQVVIHADGIDELRGKLHAKIDGPDEESPAEKRKYYKALTALLKEAEPFYEYASWSYQDDERHAGNEFYEWVNEIEANMATEPDETGEDVDGMERLDADKRYIVVSLIFLLHRPHPWHDDLDDEDDDSYTRPRLGELVDSINLLDFEHGVVADASFLVPGSDADGFSWSDLADEGWEHLKILHSGSKVTLPKD
jgi:hypothetical protein